ncbi:MAG: hypothetical protein H6825_16395 [Planctomycetes bacterium]|nr:hypothetical protein [Planctomycetota bacterium]
MRRILIVTSLAAALAAGCVKTESKDMAAEKAEKAEAPAPAVPATLELDDAEVDQILDEVDVLSEEEAAKKAEAEIDASNADAELAKLMAEIKADGDK